MYAQYRSFCGVVIECARVLYFAAQVAPEFEPIFEGGTYTVYVDEDTEFGESLFAVFATIRDC